MSNPDGPQIDIETWAEELWDQQILPHIVSINTFFEENTGTLLAAVAAALPPPPPPDTRTPIQKMLEAFELESDRALKESIANWNNSTDRQSLHDMAAAGASAASDAKTQADATMEQYGVDGATEALELDVALAAAGAILGKLADATEKKEAPTDAQVHVSDSADVFPDWHISGGKLDEDFDLPLLVPLSDEPVKDGVTRADLIKKARDMIPQIPVDMSGKAKAGTLSWVPYPVRGTAGWMYTDDPKGDYVKSLDAVMRKPYDDAKAAADAADADPAKTDVQRRALRAAQWNAAACIAVKNQEGAPSAINTYDGLVLSWGIGIAGPGKLPQTFHQICQDPHVKKALYLCGFLYQGTVIGNQYHGGYQIVDLGKKEITFRDNFWHKNSDPGKSPHKKGEFEGNAYKALHVISDQKEMIMLLVQLAKDPLTAPTIFAPNYKMIQSFVALTSTDEIASEALYVFAGEVRHNWGFDTAVIKWAVDHFDATERALAKPSPERDAAIEFELTRLRKNYVATLQSGANTQDGSKVDLGGYLGSPLVGPPNPDHYVCVDYRNDKKADRYDLGPVSQCDLLFPSDNVDLLRLENGNVIVQIDGGPEQTYTQKGVKVP